MILGSCVGLCLYDRVLSMGGATHYMLPKWVGTGKPSTRYGDVAINTLIKQFQLRGCKPSELQAMVFGGASMFQGGQGYQIGARNIEIAMHILDEHGIDVLTKNLGGERGRKIKMRTDIGTVSVRLIGNR
jgi:chemotaxis protein CheD